MDPKPRYGRTELGPIHMFEPWEINFSDGRPIDPNMSRAEVLPATMLPEWVVTFDQPVRDPELVLTLKLRGGATPAAVATDLFEVWKSLNERERNLKGAGLYPAATRD